MQMNADLETAILEEDLENTYEPTDDEIRDYAKYLGFNLDEDEDLLHIAKEGLKAPLPPGWKACQTNEGDIYYCNENTSKSQWEHPLDDFYKERYQAARAKKKGLNPPPKSSDKPGNQATKVPVGGPQAAGKPGPMNPGNKLFGLGFNLDQAIIEEEHTEEDRRDSEASFLKDDPILGSMKDNAGGIGGGKGDDFEHKKKEIDAEFDRKKAEIDQLYEGKLKEAIEAMTREKEEEKAKIAGEMSKKIKEQEDIEIRRYEDDLRRKLKEEYEGKYKDSKAKYDGEIAGFRSKLVKENEKKLTEYKNELTKQFQGEISALEAQLDELKSKSGLEKQLISPSKDPMYGELEEQKLKFREEQERLYQKEIERYNRELQVNLEKRKEAEIKKYNEMFADFCKNYEKTKQLEKESELKKYEAELEREYSAKLDTYKREIEQQIAITKQVSENQLREINSAKKTGFKKEMDREYGKLGANLLDERSQLNAAHEEELRKLEKELDNELQTYKSTVIKNFDLEIQDLEKHIAEKRKKIIGDANKLTEEEFLKHEDTLRLYPDLIQIYRHIQSLKQEIAKKDLALKNEKENQVSLKNELSVLNEELSKLKTALKDKEYKSTIEPLRQLEETLMSKLKQKEQTLHSLQQHKSPSPNIVAGQSASHQISAGVNAGNKGNLQPQPSGQQQHAYYVSPKYSSNSAIPANQGIHQGHISQQLLTSDANLGSNAGGGANGGSNQTIEKLYSEIKELKNLISKQTTTSDSNKEMIKNVLKTNTLGKKA